MKTVKVSRPIAKGARDQSIGSQLGGATATGPGVGYAGLGIAIDWAGRVAEGSKSGSYLAVALGSMYSQSGHCKLKPNALVSEQCSL